MFRTTALTAALPTPMPHRVRLTIAIATAICFMVSTTPAARADIITQLLGGGVSETNVLWGQSLVTPAGGPWHDLTFNFFSNEAPSATTPTAAGTAFLLSQEYLGTPAPANLNSSTPGFLAASTGIVAGEYTFAPDVTVQPNKTYWVYENSFIPIVSGGNFVSGTHAYFSNGVSNFQIFPDFSSNNFRLSGDVVTSTVPAPPAVVLVGLGIGCVALRRYPGRRAT
jgi:hypothetical protein